MATMNVTNRAAAYLRVSTKDQSEEHQLPDILQQAKRDERIIPEHFIFRDRLSGLKNETEREGLNALLQLTRDDIDIVYLWEISRLSRDFDAFDELIKKFKTKKINVCFLNPTKLYLYDFGTTTENITTSIVLMVVARIAFYEIELKSLRTKSGMRDKIERGEAYNSASPYGYMINDKQILVPDYNTVSDIDGFRNPVEVVQSIFKMFNNGMKQHHIADKLNSYNIPTNFEKRLKDDTKEIVYKNGKTIVRENLQWVKVSVYSILKNEVYAGTKTLKQSIKIDGEDKVIEKTITTPAIIDKETFLLTAKKRNDNKYITEKSTEDKFLLRGLLVCDCGRHYVGSSRSHSAYYTCGSTKGKHNRSYNGCTALNINTQRIEFMIWDTIKEVYREYAHKETQEKTASDFSKESKAIEFDIQMVEKQIKQFENQIKNIAKRMIHANDRVFESLNDESKLIEKQIKDKDNELNTLKLKKGELKKYTDKIDELKKINFNEFDISAIENDHSLKKEAIRKVVENITVCNIIDGIGKKYIEIQVNVVNHFGTIPPEEKYVSYSIIYYPNKGIYRIANISDIYIQGSLSVGLNKNIAASEWTKLPAFK